MDIINQQFHRLGEQAGTAQRRQDTGMVTMCFTELRKRLAFLPEGERKDARSAFDAGYREGYGDMAHLR